VFALSSFGFWKEMVELGVGHSFVIVAE